MNFINTTHLITNQLPLLLVVIGTQQTHLVRRQVHRILEDILKVSEFKAP